MTALGSVSITGGTIDGAIIGSSSPTNASFTSLTASALLSNNCGSITWSGSTDNAYSHVKNYSVHTGSSSASQIALYDWHIGADRVNLTTAQAASYGYRLVHTYGGGSSGLNGATSCVGNRGALQVVLNNQSATNTDAVLGTNPFLVAGCFTTQIGYNEGGTSNVYPGHSRGQAFGINPVCILQNGATNYTGCVGQEINVAITSTASAQEKVGLQIVKLNTDASQGGNRFDTAIKIADQSKATATWDYGVTFGSNAARWPFAANSTLIASLESLFAPCVAKYGVDFRQTLFLTAAFSSIGFQVDGTGNTSIGGALEVGNYSFQARSAGLVIDCFGQKAVNYSIASGGTGWNVGDKFITPTNGVYKVIAISNGVATAVTQLVPDVCSTPPPNPISTTPTNNNIFHSLTSGLTLNLNWSLSNQLSLCPSGSVIAPTPLPGDASGNVATTAFVQNAIRNSATSVQVIFSASLLAQQAVQQATLTKCLFDTVEIDTGSYFDPTSGRYNPLVPGKYKIDCAIQLAASSGAVGATKLVAIYKNGSPYANTQITSANGNSYSDTLAVSAIVSLDGITDYVEVWGMAPGGAGTTFAATPISNGRITRFEAYRIGP